MSLAQRVEGVIANYLGQKDEQVVISEAVVPRVERFDPAAAKLLPWQPADEYRRLLDTWRKMDLSQVFGFPLWEAEVFGLLG